MDCSTWLDVHDNRYLQPQGLLLSPLMNIIDLFLSKHKMALPKLRDS